MKENAPTFARGGVVALLCPGSGMQPLRGKELLFTLKGLYALAWAQRGARLPRLRFIGSHS